MSGRVLRHGFFFVDSKARMLDKYEHGKKREIDLVKWKLENERKKEKKPRTSAEKELYLLVRMNVQLRKKGTIGKDC